jgi:serine/threonine-protein kinase
MEGRVIGQYRVTGVLGEGGMGIVYAAEHTLLDRPAAVKVLLPKLSGEQEIVTRFFNEARAATAIRHPGIVEVYDFGWTSDGSAFIVMEHLQGETLRARRQRRPMRWSTALALVRQIAGALAAAHAKGIVHRDLKPDNIFLVPDPEVPGGERIKLLDFGIAKLAGALPSRHKTQTGMMMGTPTYMAPEQCRGVAVDSRADLYALGCILFELCTGRPPFIGEGEGDVLVAHIHEPPPTIASLVDGVPEEIELLVQRMLAKSPADRVQTADELLRLIDAARTAIGQLSMSGSLPAFNPLVPLDDDERDRDRSDSAGHQVHKPDDAGGLQTTTASRRLRRDAVAPDLGTAATLARPSSSRLQTTLSSAAGSLPRAASHPPTRLRAAIGITAAGLASIIAVVFLVLLFQGEGGSDNPQLEPAVSASSLVLPQAPTAPSIDTVAPSPSPAVEVAPSPPPVPEGVPGPAPVPEAAPSPPPEAAPLPVAPSPPTSTPGPSPVPERRALRPPPADDSKTRASGKTSTWRAIEIPVTIRSTPSGAAIHVDGSYFGTTPRTIKLTRNYDYKIEVRLTGYQTQEFGIHPTSPIKKNVMLKRASPSSLPN